MVGNHKEQPRSAAAWAGELLIVAVLAFDLLFSLIQPHFQLVSIESINLPRLKPKPPRQQPLRPNQRLRCPCPAQ